MAFEINDLTGILILVLFAIPTIAATNINCSGRAFHCVNSTHFMICVDLGGGVSTTIDDFVIPCPTTTVCNENNIFECDFPEEPTLPLQVIGVNKQSDTSEPTSVTNSVTTSTQTSEIFSVFNENITATTLPIPEDVTPAVKVEVLENIKNSSGGNSDNTTSVDSSFIGSTNEIVKDKQTSNNTLTTFGTDKNNKNLETDVETSILEAVNASSTDKSTPIDTVTSVIGLINLISTDPPSVGSTKPSSSVLTSVDSSYDILATEQYITKEVTKLSEKFENVTEKNYIPTEVIFNEISTTTDRVSLTPVVNTLIVNEINNKFENMNKTNSGNHTIAEQKQSSKSNNTNKLLPETTTEYLVPIKTINISEPINIDLSPQTTMDSAFGFLGLVEIMSAEHKQSIPSIKYYIDTSYGNNATTTTSDLFNTKLETTLIEKPVTAEVISTTPITNLIIQNVINNDSTTELNPASDIRIIKTVQETKYYVPEPTTVATLQSTTEKTSVPINTVTNIKYTTETILTSEALFNNYSRVEKPTIVAQPLEIIRPTVSPTVVIDNLYQINGDINQTLISTKNISVDTMNITEVSKNTVYNASGIDVMNDKKNTEPILAKNPGIETTTAETLRNGFTVPVMELSKESTAIHVASSVNESLIRNVMNDTLWDNTTDTVSTTQITKMASNISSSNSGTEPSIIEYTTIDISKTEIQQNEFTTHAMEAKDRSPANDLISVHTTPAPYSVTSGPVTKKIVKDLTSQSEMEINAHTAPDGYSSVDQGTTQRTMTDPANKSSEPLNQPDTLKAMMLPEIFNTYQWTNNVADEVSTTQINLNNIAIRVTTPFPVDFTETTTVLNNIVKSGNQDNSSATSLANTQEVSLKIKETSAPPSNHYVTERSSTTAEIVHTTPSTDSTKIFIPASTNTPKIANIHTVLATDYKIETSSLFSVDFTRSTNVENATDIPTRTLLQQEPVTQKKNITTTATTPGTVKTAGYALDTKNIDHNTSSQKDSVNIENRITKEDSIINKTETLNPIYGKNSDDAISSAFSEYINKDESIKIVSVLSIVNSSGNAMNIEMLQPTTTNPSLSNDYITTSESQASSGYVTAPDNVPDYNSVHVVQSVQKYPDVIVSFAETKLINSSTPNSHTFPVIELSTERVQYDSTEAFIISPADFQGINLKTAASDSVTEKTNDYFSTEAMLSQLNKLPNVQAETSASSEGRVPDMAVPSNGLTTVPVYEEFTTIKDSAFIITSTQTTPKIVTDNNIKITSEPPPLTSNTMEPHTVKYNNEATQRATEPTQTTSLDKTNQNVQTMLKTTDLPQYVTTTVNNNIHQSVPLLPIVAVTASERTIEHTQTTPLVQTSPLTAIGTIQKVQPLLKNTVLPQYMTSTVNKNISQTIPVIEATVSTLLEINQNIQPGMKFTDLPQYMLSTVNKIRTQSMPSLPMLEVTAPETSTEPFQTTIFAQTTPLDNTNQNFKTGVRITDLPENVTSTVNNSIPQSMPSLTLIETIASQMTTESTYTTPLNQATPLAVTGKTNQGVLSVIKTTDLPQHVITTTNNISQPMPIVQVTLAQKTTELAQTTRLDKTKQNVQPVLKPTDLPQYVMSNVNNNNPQPMSSLPISGVTASQITSEHTDKTNAFAETTPLAAAGKTDQDFVPGIQTGVPQYITVTYSYPQSIGGITTETIPDTTVPDSMVESIKVVGDKKSGTHQGEKILIEVMYNTSTVHNYSVKSVGNIVDHESIVVGATSKNYKQKTPITAAPSVNINKAEIVNHTESNWMTSDVNIDTIKIKESSIEEEDPKISVLKLEKDVPNKNLDSDSAIRSKIQPKDGKSIDKIEYRLTTVKMDYNQVKTPKNVTQSKTKITSENKNAEIDSSVNTNIEIIDVKTFQVQVDSKNISDYSLSNTKASNTMYHHNLSLQNSTINDELEQHLISANHTITTEVQSHVNESDKQSIKTSKEPAINGTSVHNPYLISTKDASSKDTRAITVHASIFNCSNHTRGKYSDKKDCRTFYTCVGNLQPIIGTCPNNTVFSEINKQCTRNLSHCVRNNQFRCLLEGRFTDFFKDNIYYICVKNRNNHFIRYKLQCQEDYHLNKDSIKCEKNEEMSTQIGSSVSETINDESKPGPKSEKIVISDDFECVKEGKFPNTNDCSKYYICIKNINKQFIRYKLQCQDGYHLNKDSVKCEKNEEISTQLVSETINYESKPKPNSEKIVSSNDFECEKEGKFPYAKDCSKYYVCTKFKNVYRRKITKCASDNVFDKNKKKCVESDSGEC